MFDLSQVSPQSLGFAVFVGLLALRCGVLWVGISGVIALLAASDPLGFLSRITMALDALTRWAASSPLAGGF